MKKKSKNTNEALKHKLIGYFLLSLAAFLIITGGLLLSLKTYHLKIAADQASIVPIRELILQAVEGLKKDAPVEARTGDVYFPESRLYLPAPDTTAQLTYGYFKGDDATQSPEELSVSTDPVGGSSALYSAWNMEDLFERVPKLQACGRGVKLVYEKYTADEGQNELKHTVRLANGRDIYVYLEKDCPELSATADLFKNIRSY
jgi:hypothetical protein